MESVSRQHDVTLPLCGWSVSPRRVCDCRVECRVVPGGLIGKLRRQQPLARMPRIAEFGLICMLLLLRVVHAGVLGAAAHQLPCVSPRAAIRA